MNVTDKIKRRLVSIRKPARYTGGEVNAVKKDLSSVRLKFGIAFPDVYDVGMSHLGIQVIYQTLNSRDYVACERVFAPWKDMEALLRQESAPLATLESNIPLCSLDILGFSLQYELSYTNVLNMLDLGGITLRAGDRKENEPVIIGGGPSAFNPEPVAGFFDCFLLGDGEEAAAEICDAVIAAKEKGLSRKDTVESLARIPGVYVPSLYGVSYNADGTVKAVTPAPGAPSKVKKRILLDLNSVPVPVMPVVPYVEAVHDRYPVEIARGCVRGCRFCHAGMVYRPLRERDPERITAAITEAIRNTGYEEISLLSLSTGDYSSIEGLMCSLVSSLESRRIAVSLPSMRVGTLSKTLAEEIRKIRKTGFTMAPEAGTERLRNVVNKGIEEKDLIASARSAFELGWRLMKLYFMVGLPTETMEDVMEITRLARDVREEGRKASGKRPDVNVSASVFVPKPHTPFQWAPMLSPSESAKRLGAVRDGARRLKLDFKWHESGMALLEGVFSRGDRRLANVVERAFKKGCRFDGWTEEFREGLWKEALAEENLSADFYALRARGKDEIFPWEHLDSGVDRSFLYAEYEAALKGAETPECRLGPCTACGVCDHKEVKNITFAGKTPEPPRKSPDLHSGNPVRIRIRFSRTGGLKYLSHLEESRAFARAVRRAGLAVRFSQGFHPAPRIVFGTPLPVGIESMDEYVDVELEAAPGLAMEDFVNKINLFLPPEMKAFDAGFIPLQLPALSAIIKGQVYIAEFKDGLKDLDICSDFDGIGGYVRDFTEKGSFVVEVKREKEAKTVDLKKVIRDLRVHEGPSIEFSLMKADGPGVKPHEAISGILRIPSDKAALIPIRKIKTII